MRKLLLALVFAAFPAFAQYGPAGNPVSASGAGFQPLAKTSAIAATTTSANIQMPAPAIVGSVTITGTAGQFGCTCNYLSVGMAMTITGTFGGTGSISGYTSGTTYLITATNGTSTFTLSNVISAGGGPIVTTAGTPTGLTYTALNYIFVDTNTSQQVQVYNPTTGTAFVIFCPTSSCTAAVGSAGTSTSDYPVAPGAVIVMTFPTGTTYAAVILSTGSGTVYLTPGIGL